MSKKRAYFISQYSFTSLRNPDGPGKTVLAEISKIAHRLQPEQVKKGEDYLRDKLDYYEFILAKRYEHLNFGDVFLARENNATGEVVGFVLAFHNFFCSTERINSLTYNQRFPLEYCIRHFAHDVPFLRDLDVLGKFAYCFHIGVIPEKTKRKVGCASSLLNAMEFFYCQSHTVKNGKSVGSKRFSYSLGHSSFAFEPILKEPALILAASIHEHQQNIIQIIKNRNKCKRPHAKLNNELDFETIFLDHYFDQSVAKGIWFRLVQIPDNRLFLKQMNYRILPQAFSTIIPIQLNRSVIQLNKVLKSMGAKVLWSSFFHDNELLKKKNLLPRESLGFFQSILEASKEQYPVLLESLGKIINYLKEKHLESKDKANISSAFNRRTSEIFFFAGGIHQMPSFVKPVLLDIEKTKEATGGLIDFLVHQEVISTEPPLSPGEKIELALAFQQVLISNSDENRAKRDKWITRLSLGKEEIKFLEDFSKAKFKGDARYPEFKDAKRPKNARKSMELIYNTKVVNQQQLDKWRHYVQLHRSLYEIDAAVMEDRKKYWWCHGILPINYTSRKKVMGIMFTFRCEKIVASPPEITAEDVRTRMDTVAQAIATTLPRDLLNNLIKLQESNATEMSIRQSIGVITSRNMAHHLGSHILPNLDTPESLERLSNKDFKDAILPEIAKLNGYIRTKTQLQADMNSTYPVSSVSKWLHQEVIKEFTEQRLLRKYVSGTRLREINIEFKIQNDWGPKDIMVQIPNGALGSHALFIILTNFIRNSSKYENTNHLDSLDITLMVLEPSTNSHKTNLKSPTTTSLEKSKELVDLDRGYKILIYDNISRDEDKIRDIVDSLNSLIKQYRMNLRNGLQGGGLGIIEMVTAAAYLRKKGAEHAASRVERSKEIPLLKAEIHTVKESGQTNHYLAYSIYLKKPRLALLITQNESQSIDLRPWHKNFGIRHTYENEVALGGHHGYSHDFVLAFGDKIRKRLELTKRFPLRWLDLEDPLLDPALIHQLNQDDGHLYTRLLWECWVKRYARRKGLKVEEIQLVITSEEGAFPDISSVNPSNLFVFSHHGEGHPSLIDPDAFAFYQYFGSSCPTGKLILEQYGTDITPEEEHQQAAFRFQLFEAAITRIAILDERVQKQIIRRTEMDEEEKNHFDVLSRMSIHIPRPDQGGVNLLRSKQGPAAASWINNLMETKSVDFIVLHLGLLESWVGSDPDNINRWIEENITAIDPRPEIIIVTGRGRPQRLSPKFCFQSASLISEHIVGGAPSKFHLCQILFSSRTRPLL